MKIPAYQSMFVQFKFAHPADGMTSQIDEWFEEYLEIRDREFTKCVPLSLQEDRCANHVARILLLGRVLLHQWKLPIFELPGILEISPGLQAEDVLTCKVKQPTVAHIPRVVFENAYMLSSSICHWASRNRASAANVTSFLNQIEDAANKSAPPMALGGTSTVQMLEVAYRLSIPFFHVGRGIYQVGTGSFGRYFFSGSSDRDSAVGLTLSGDKEATSRILRSRGLPAPKHFVVVSKDACLRAASELQYPVVVKPNDANRGEGVTLGVRSDELLLRAFDGAARRSRSGKVLVEKQVAGFCYRLLILGGKYLYCTKRFPLYVTGDGANSLGSILDSETALDLKRPSWMRKKYYRMDNDAKSWLAENGHPLTSVPQNGERVFLRPIASAEWGGFYEDVTEEVHKDNRDIAIEAAAALGLEVAGVDIISENISESWKANGAILNEVNASPMLGVTAPSRAYIPQYFNFYLGKRHSIPIELFDSGFSGDSGDIQERFAFLRQQGSRVWVIMGDYVIEPGGGKTLIGDFLDGAEIDYKGALVESEESPAFRTLHQLLLSRTVDHILIQSDDQSGQFGA